jgi:hypothetical protein
LFLSYNLIQVIGKDMLGGDKKMTYTLACKDTGTDCPYVARGETKEEMMDDAVKNK